MSAVPQPPQPPTDIPQDAPPAVHAAAAGEKLSVEQERSALDWFLGPTVVIEWDVTVQFETPAGMVPLIFHMHQVDSSRLQEIDEENRSGDGPFAKLDPLAFNAAVVAEATVYLTDHTGRKVTVDSEEFRGQIPSTPLAMQLRFKKQGGILEYLVERVREKAGFSPDRVGTAQRSLVEAGKR